MSGLKPTLSHGEKEMIDLVHAANIVDKYRRRDSRPIRANNATPGTNRDVRPQAPARPGSTPWTAKNVAAAAPLRNILAC